MVPVYRGGRENRLLLPIVATSRPSPYGKIDALNSIALKKERRRNATLDDNFQIQGITCFLKASINSFAVERLGENHPDTRGDESCSKFARHFRTMFLSTTAKKFDSFKREPWLIQDPVSQRLRETSFFFFFFSSRESIVHSPPRSRFFASFLFLAVSPRVARRIILRQVFSCLRLVPRDCIPAIEFKGIFALPGRRYELPATAGFTAGNNFHLRGQHFREPIERNVFRSYPTFIHPPRSTIHLNHPPYFHPEFEKIVAPIFFLFVVSISKRIFAQIRSAPS